MYIYSQIPCYQYPWSQSYLILLGESAPLERYIVGFLIVVKTGLIPNILAKA